MSDPIILVGMNVRPLAQSAVRAGFDVTAIDAFGFLDLPAGVRSISLVRDLGGLETGHPGIWQARMAQAAQSQPPGALAYSGGFENMPELVAEMSAVHELLGNPPAALRGVRDPFRLREVVRAAGLETPEILPPGAQPDPDLRWLSRPLRSGMGFGIEPWEGTVPDNPEMIVQRQVDGEPRSVSFISNGREAGVFSMTRQLSGDPAFGAAGFAYAGNLLIPDPDENLLDRMSALAGALTEAFGLVGLNGIDFILDGDDVFVLEVNPRYSASMELVEESLDAPLLEWHAAGCRRQSLPALPERRDRSVFGKAIVYARENGTLPDTTGWPGKGRRDVPHPGGPIRTGLPICTVTATGRDQNECYANLQAEAAELLDSVKP